MHPSSMILLGTALSLGFRHGIDWDHLAAIVDIVGTRRRSEIASGSGSAVIGSGSAGTNGNLFILPSMYALGHALVVVALGVTALCFATVLPQWLDAWMQRLVGLTLVLLAALVFRSMCLSLKGEAELRLQSRWMLLFDWLQSVFCRSRVHTDGTAKSARIKQYGKRSAFGIGMIHGIGAETGTQVLLIASVGGAGNQDLGLAMLLSFVIGLFLSNLFVAVLSSTGFATSSRFQPVYVAASLCTCVFSLFVGACFVAGRAECLPNLQRMLGA
jgi:high-affinity nickel-transport protein